MDSSTTIEATPTVIAGRPLNMPTSASLMSPADIVLAGAHALVIDCPDMYPVACDELRNVKGRIKQITEQKENLLAPVRELDKRIRALVDPPLLKLREAESLIKGKVDGYLTEEERKQREEQRWRDEAARRAREEAEAAARKADEERRAAEAAARKAEEDRIAAQRAAEQAERDRIAAEEAARQAEADGRAAEAAAERERAARAQAEAAERQAEADRQAREAAEARAAAEAMEAEAAAQRTVATVIVAAPVEETPRVAGISRRKLWRGATEDKLAFVRYALGIQDEQPLKINETFWSMVTIDESALDRFAVMTKGSVNVPGVRFEQRSSIGSRSA
jgi:hypothetical protein